MKKFQLITLTIIIILFITNCTVNKNCGEIIIMNYTTADCKDLKIGKLYIGFIPRSSSKIVHFVKERTAADIESKNFDAKYSHVYGNNYYEGKIDLKLNYSYSMELAVTTDSNNERIYYLSKFQGYQLGTDESDIQENINQELRY